MSDARGDEIEEQRALANLGVTPCTPQRGESNGAPKTQQRFFPKWDDLGAWWGLLLFVCLYKGFWLAIETALGIGTRSSAQATPAVASLPHSPISILVGEGVAFAGVALVTWTMSRIEDRPFGVYGLGGVKKWARFAAGFAWGFFFLSLLVGALWRNGLLKFDGRLLFGARAIAWGMVWLAGFLLVAFFEEFLMRGYVQYTLARGLRSLYGLVLDGRYAQVLGFFTAALILSFLFGLGHKHNPGESLIGLIAAGLIGLIFCLTLYRTGSLWWAVGFHASWDWAQSFVFGVADSGTMIEGHLLATHAAGRVSFSGGATGPEGSILIFPTLGAIVLVVVLTLPKRRGGAQDELG